MPFQHPFQCIQCIQRPGAQGQNFLVGAAGPKLYVLDSTAGDQLSVWPSNIESESKKDNAKDTESHDHGNVGGNEPPEKKRKLSPTPQEVKQSERKANGSEKSQDSKLAWSTIPIITASKSGEHVVAVTGEDKCIRVFKVDASGALSQLSERCMPKRPFSIVLSTDETAIICGDKFGDVYSLPLFLREDYKPPPKKNQPAQPVQPSASTLTVHTKRNLQALEQQLKLGAKTSEKTGPAFELTLLLGHVSMLTDVAFVDLPVKSGAASSRPYIITADRDEHIRVSRGPPQTHVIQSYCLGHTAFVSRLCVPPWDVSTLISGGGDDYLLVWRWAEGKLLQKAQLPLGGEEVAAEKQSAPEVAVNGILPVSFADNDSLRSKAPGAIVVTLEGIPKLFPFVFGSDGKLVAQTPVDLLGNALGMASLDVKGNIIVSIDCVHEPGSTKEQRRTADSPQKFLQVFTASAEQEWLSWTEVDSSMVKGVEKQGTFDLAASGEEKEMKKDAQALTSTLYSIGNLRKWGKEED
ncbi:hypothetical protein AJ79_00413 [Helicocarpus griseus UAMH5409]|uniref:Uncharacterized protein n=1 Tax=Helicocarpus griseus UAMH5409 TaxID=1447875 RepID=A0A2B7Y3G1_9EURO|nr:hypothetical protein AJ79_00413 [Helicocarpus griseus UAMH5409]